MSLCNWDLLTCIVFKGAKFNGNTRLWIGISDVGTENEFTYLSDGTLVNFVCESSAAGRAGIARPGDTRP